MIGTRVNPRRASKCVVILAWVLTRRLRFHAKITNQQEHAIVVKKNLIAALIFAAGMKAFAQVKQFIAPRSEISQIDNIFNAMVESLRIAD